MTPQDRTAPPAAAPRSIGALFTSQVHVFGHRPLLTFYGDTTGERTELSYATFDNWASKAANLLAEELRLAPGDRVALLATRHWTAAVVAVAAWKTGAVVTLDADGTADVVVTTQDAAEQHAAHPGLVVLGSGMGGRVDGAAPGLAFGDEVLAFADDYDDPAVGLDRLALLTPAAEQSQGELLRTVEGALRDEDRLLCTTPITPATIAGLLLAPVLAGASIVWCPDARGEVDKRAADERVTVTLDARGAITRS